MTTCMQYKHSKDIYNAMQRFIFGITDGPDLHLVASFAPVIDGILLKEDPKEVIANHNSSAYDFFKSLDVMIGVCESEGSILLGLMGYVENYISFNVTEGISSDFMCKHIFPQLAGDYYNNDTAIAQAICRKYTSKGSLQEQGLKALDFYGDLFFYSPAVQSLNTHALNNHKTKQFQYMNRRRSVFSIPLEFYPWFKGAGHGSELPFLFPMKSNGTRSSDDMSLSLAMIKYWSNFAKKGDPNGPGLPMWPQYEITTKQYALLDTNITIHNNLYKDRMNFWLTQIMQHNLPTTTPCTSAGCVFG